MDTITPDWTRLPRDLLTSIATRLHTRIDILRFRAVCCSFRCKLPHPPKVMFPESILRTTDFLKGPHPDNEDPFVLTECTVYAIQPLDDETSPTWLVQVQESTSGKVRIKDSLSGFHFKSLENKSLNLLDYRVKEISKSYVFESAAIREDKVKLYDRYGSYKMSSEESSVVAKVVFSSFLDETVDGFVVMAKFRDKELSVWRNVDKKWTNINIDLRFREGILDMVYRNHKFYTVNHLYSTVIVDSKSLTVVEVQYPGGLEGLSYLCLVDLSNELLLIASYDRAFEGYFIVFKLDEENHEWVRVTVGLEDSVFFWVDLYNLLCPFSRYDGINFKYEDVDPFGPFVKIFNLKDHYSSERIAYFPNPLWYSSARLL
ncbi:F-box protein SKIP23-like [Pistacia vera]|uniref:F-box protein SKIP23-like n=1 Tax=Pistacia vera TaxID=55513 RepID=UPI001263BE22|nr:F-box protein SKIP23-like [Pistacia vera]